MRILFCTGIFPGPSETFIVRQLAGVAKSGVGVRVVAFEKGGGALPPELKDVPVVLLRDMPAGRGARVVVALQILLDNIRHAPALLRVLFLGLRDSQARYLTCLALAEAMVRAGACDVVHAQFGHLGRMLGLVKEAGVLKQPLVVSFRGGDSTGFLRQAPGAYRRLYGSASHCFPVSEAIRNIHLAEGCPPEKISVLRSGLDPEEWPFLPRTFHGPARLLCVGRHVEKKGFRHAVEAVALLRVSGIGVRLDLAGDGPLRESIEALVREQGLQEDVILHGWVAAPRVRELMEQADLLVVPSLTAADGDAEGIPNVVKEAMLSGLPVIASRHGGITELVRDRETGLLVEEGDSPGLAAAVRMALAEPEAVAGYARRAREFVANEYDIGPLTGKLLEVYKRLAADRGLGQEGEK